MTAALAPGLKHQILLTVEKHHIADAYGNPGIEVFATPALTHFSKTSVENASDLFSAKMASVLESGWTSDTLEQLL